MKKFLAFTLAETLIVMGVIGIVSALTLPNLNSSTGDKERVAKVKKIYQNLNDALGRAEAVYGPYDTWFINDADATAKNKRTGERLTEFMKVSKTCAQVANQGCFTSGNSKEFDGDNYSDFDSGTVFYRIITADGTSLAIIGTGNAIIVDIDGPNKGAYTNGKDLFYFNIDNDLGVVPAGYDSAFADLIADIMDKGTGATAWIIKYDNADYLKFKNNSGLCPNGTTVTEANPRCK